MRKQTRAQRINKQINKMIKEQGVCKCKRYALPHPPHKLAAYRTERECEKAGIDFLTQPAFTTTHEVYVYDINSVYPFVKHKTS
jgi:hypothetical protein